jgi:hypothetical protein
MHRTCKGCVGLLDKQIPTQRWAVRERSKRKQSGILVFKLKALLGDVTEDPGDQHFGWDS